MARDREFEAMLSETLAPLGPVIVKGMFGGSGLFLDGLMFALIADGVLFFKSDDATRADFDAECCGPFTYTRKGGQATLTSYWQAPERLLDEPDELVRWGRNAFGVARRAASRKARPKGAKRKKSKDE